MALLIDTKTDFVFFTWKSNVSSAWNSDKVEYVVSWWNSWDTLGFKSFTKKQVEPQQLSSLMLERWNEMWVLINPFVKKIGF